MSALAAVALSFACASAPPSPHRASIRDTDGAVAEDTIDRRIDAYVRAQMARRQIPGLALVVVRDGITVFMKGYGIADVENSVPVTAETVFDISSITKTFTAAAIMRLAESGALDLERSVRDYLHEAPESWSGITVRHLLTHTAGVPATDVPTVNGAWLADYTTRQMLEHAFATQLTAAPGENFLYSDRGYFLLGAIIERATGMRYAEFLQRAFIGPFSMGATTLLDQHAIVTRRAGTYFLRDRRLARNRRYVQVELPSAYGLLTTARDFAKWESALARGQVISPAALDAMWTSARTENGLDIGYGLGWDVYELNGNRAAGHGGGTGTYYLRLPDARLGIIVLSNLALSSLDGGRRRLEGSNPRTIAQAVADMYVGRLLISRLQRNPDGAARADTARARTALTDLASRRRDSPLLTPELVDALTRNARRTPAAWPVESAPFELVQCHAPRPAPSRLRVPVSRVCHYRQEHQLETRFTSLYESADGRIADFELRAE